jgi:hypothetical protein
MKNKLIKFGLVLIPSIWVGGMGLAYLASVIFSFDFNLRDVALVMVIFAIVLPVLYVMGIFDIFPRSNYLESRSGEKPKFKNVCVTTARPSRNFDFARLKTEIEGKYELWYSDDAEKILKFRTRAGFLKNWGAVTWLKYDESARTLFLNSFSMVGKQFKSAWRVQREIKNFAGNEKNF